jgi:hypothetical protein
MAESDRDLVRRAATMGAFYRPAINQTRSNYSMRSWSVSRARETRVPHRRH